jgi:ParB family chromosome partitioning protein
MVRKIGKGLSELLATIEDERVVEVAPVDVVENSTTAVYEIEISRIFPNPDQPRKFFGEAEQTELASSIKIHGILQPLILVKSGDKYMIVAGERRYRAAKKLGLEKVPAIVKQFVPGMIREISLIENLQREDLNAIEEAEALRELMSFNGYTQEQLAERIGKARSSVTNSLRLLSLEEEVKSLVRQDRLSAGHARTLIPVTDKETQIDFAYESADGSMSVRDLEKKVRYHLHPELKPKRLSDSDRTRLSLEMRNLVDDMKRVFRTKVKLIGNSTKGRITIDYFSQDDLDRVFDLIEKLKD